MANDREISTIKQAKQDEEFETLLRQGVQQQELKKRLGEESIHNAKSR